MKILSINNSNNQITHKAVNQKFLKQARDLSLKYGDSPPIGDLLQEIDISLIYGIISKQDALDTLYAIKKYAKNALEAIDDDIKNILKWDC